MFMLGWACANSAATAARSLTIRGSVVDGEGSPLSGAKVHLAPVMDDYEGFELRLVQGLWAEPVGTRETATDGRYALDAAPGRRWRLIVERPGRITVTRRLEPLYEDRELRWPSSSRLACWRFGSPWVGSPFLAPG